MTAARLAVPLLCLTPGLASVGLGRGGDAAGIAVAWLPADLVLAVVAALVAAVAVARRTAAERRLTESENRYRALVEASPDGLMVHQGGRIVLANARLAAMLGLPGPDVLVGRPVRDVTRFSEAAPIRLARADGSLLEIETTSARVDLGGAPAVQVAVRDVTKRRRAERAAEERSRALEAVNRELEQFASIAAHDLRAPLRHLSLLAGWLEEELGPRPPGKVPEYLAQVRERAQRMSAMIDGLRHYALAGRRDFPTSLVDLPALVRATVELLAPPPGLRVEVDADPPVLEAAEPPLAMVLRNLIDNALRHHDRGRGTIRVILRRQAEGVELAVADDGPGMPERVRNRAFEMFTSFGPDLRPAGDGVGLALVRRIVAGQGGRIWIEPAAEGGRGTTVRFTWPSARVAPAAAGVAEPVA